MSWAVALLLGVSRKSFIGRLSRGEAPKERLAGSLAAGLAGLDRARRSCASMTLPRPVRRSPSGRMQLARRRPPAQCRGVAVALRPG